MKNDIYTNCPSYETINFILRQVRMEDAKELLKCYSDKAAVLRMNADNCTSNFYYTTIEQMRDCIAFWLEEYNMRHYVRFSVICKKSQDAVGTIEVFGGEYGVLRIDIATAYEENLFIEELIRLAVFNLVSDFGIVNLEIKAVNTSERISVLKEFGFSPSKTYREGMGYYERSITQHFCAEKGVAFCGLACCICSENEKCAGCRNDGCKDKNWCKSFNCCKEKGLKGCWECSEFPCDNPMLNKIKIRTFAKFISEFGEENLIKILRENESNGIIYHYEGQLVGDYDNLPSEDEIKELLLRRL